MSKRTAIWSAIAGTALGLIALILVLVPQQGDGKLPTNAVPGKRATFTATVTVSVNLNTNSSSYDRCEVGGLSDVAVGTQVVIINQKHEVLALDNLTKSSPDTCAFSATIKDIPAGEAMYGAKLGNGERGVIWKSADEARTVGWMLSVSG